MSVNHRVGSPIVQESSWFLLFISFSTLENLVYFPLSPTFIVAFIESAFIEIVIVFLGELSDLLVGARAGLLLLGHG